MCKIKYFVFLFVFFVLTNKTNNNHNPTNLQQSYYNWMYVFIIYKDQYLRKIWKRWWKMTLCHLPAVNVVKRVSSTCEVLELEDLELALRKSREDVEATADDEEDFDLDIEVEEEDEADDVEALVFSMCTETDDWVWWDCWYCCCCKDEEEVDVSLTSFVLLSEAGWFCVVEEDDEDDDVDVEFEVEDVDAVVEVEEELEVEVLVLLLLGLLLRCDSLGIWNFEFNPFIKPSILAAIMGEAYCKIFIISAWWSKRVAGCDVEAELEEWCDDGSAGDVEALWDFFDDLRISENEFVLWLLERP